MVSFNALLEGFSLRWKADPEVTREHLRLPVDGTEVDVSLFAIATDGIMRRLTEPVAGDDGALT